MSQVVNLLIEHANTFFAGSSLCFGIDESVQKISDPLILFVVPSSKSPFFLSTLFENSFPLTLDVDLFLGDELRFAFLIFRSHPANNPP